MMRTYWLIWMFLSLSVGLKAQIKFTANAPATVVKGNPFGLTYTLGGGAGSNIKAPSSIKGFDILYGPAMIVNSSSQIIDGNSVNNSSESYIYRLSANMEGMFTIPGATITVNDINYISDSVQVKVLPPDKNLQLETLTTSSSSSSAEYIDPNDAFVSVIISDTMAKEQECFVVTFRFYTTLEVREIGKIKLPEFDGFVLVEELSLPATRQMVLEHYNDRNYYAVDLQRTLFFPQRSGMITIPSYTMEMVFSVKSDTIVQTFFGPQHVMTEVKKTIVTSPVVMDLVKGRNAETP